MWARSPRRRPRRSLRAGAERRCVPVPLQARNGARGLVPRGRGLRAGRLPLAPRLASEALARGSRARRPLGLPALADPADGYPRARRLAARRRARGRGAIVPLPVIVPRFWVPSLRRRLVGADQKRSCRPRRNGRLKPEVALARARHRLRCLEKVTAALLP